MSGVKWTSLLGLFSLPLLQVRGISWVLGLDKILEERGVSRPSALLRKGGRSDGFARVKTSQNLMRAGFANDPPFRKRRETMGHPRVTAGRISPSMRWRRNPHRLPDILVELLLYRSTYNPIGYRASKRLPSNQNPLPLISLVPRSEG